MMMNNYRLLRHKGSIKHSHIERQL